MILLTVAVILTVILIGLVYKLLGTQIEELSCKVSDFYYAGNTDLFNARNAIEARQADAANEAASRHRAVTSRLDQVYHTLSDMQLERRVKALSNKLDDINTTVHRNSDKLGHVLSRVKVLEKPKEAKFYPDPATEASAKTVSAMQATSSKDQLDLVIELNRELEVMRASGASGQEIRDHAMTSRVELAGGRYE